MSSLEILATLVFEIPSGKQTNNGENSTPAIAVGVANQEI